MMPHSCVDNLKFSVERACKDVFMIAAHLSPHIAIYKKDVSKTENYTLSPFIGQDFLDRVCIS